MSESHLNLAAHTATITPTARRLRDQQRSRRRALLYPAIFFAALFVAGVKFYLEKTPSLPVVIDQPKARK